MANRSITVTLAANTPSTVTLTGQGPYVVVTNLDTAAVVWGREDEVNPAVAGDEAIPVLAGGEVWFRPRPSASTIAIRLISNGTPQVNVRQERKLPLCRC